MKLCHFAVPKHIFPRPKYYAYGQNALKSQTRINRENRHSSTFIILKPKKITERERHENKSTTKMNKYYLLCVSSSSDSGSVKNLLKEGVLPCLCDLRMGESVSRPCLVLWGLEDDGESLGLILHFGLCFDR